MYARFQIHAIYVHEHDCNYCTHVRCENMYVSVHNGFHTSEAASNNIFARQRVSSGRTRRWLAGCALIRLCVAVASRYMVKTATFHRRATLRFNEYRAKLVSFRTEDELR